MGGTIVAALLVAPVVIILMLPLGLLNAWVTEKLWGWFVAEQFLAVPDISVGQAWGLSMIVSYMTMQHFIKKEMDRDAVLGVLMLPFLALFSGWLVHWLVL